MIRVLVLYPRSEMNTFDIAYYQQHHLPLVKTRLAPVKLEMDLGVSSSTSPSPYIAVTHLFFRSMDDLREKYAAHGQELNEDKKKFTDIDLVFQISEYHEL